MVHHQRFPIGIDHLAVTEPPAEFRGAGLAGACESRAGVRSRQQVRKFLRDHDHLIRCIGVQFDNAIGFVNRLVQFVNQENPVARRKPALCNDTVIDLLPVFLKHLVEAHLVAAHRRGRHQASACTADATALDEIARRHDVVRDDVGVGNVQAYADRTQELADRRDGALDDAQVRTGFGQFGQHFLGGVQQIRLLGRI